MHSFKINLPESVGEATIEMDSKLLEGVVDLNVHASVNGITTVNLTILATKVSINAQARVRTKIKPIMQRSRI